jgi:ankyrin repeat protein
VKVDVLDNDGWTPLHWAACNGHLEVAKLLVANGAAVGAQAYSGQTPLHVAAECGHIDVARFLVANGAPVNDKNADGDTPVHCAAWGGNLEVIKFLLGEAGAFYDAKDGLGRTALDIARLINSTGIIEFLSSE